MKGFTSRALLTAVAVSVMAVSLLSSSAKAEGGIIFKNMKMTNNGTDVFSDNLSSSLAGWNQCIDATNTDQGLNLNKHGLYDALVKRNLSLENVGSVEFNVDVWVAPVAEQFVKGYTFSYMHFSTGNLANEELKVVIITREKVQGYYLALAWRGIDGPELKTSFYSETIDAVLQAERWAHLTVKTDPASKKVYMLMDDKQILSIPYQPDSFLSLKSLDITTPFGDGAFLKRRDTKL